MGSIFPAQQQLVRTAHKRPISKGSIMRARYLADKKTDRGRNTKREESMQIDLCDWMRATFPGVHFRCDTGSGAFNSKWQKQTHNRQQSAKGLPDMEIFAAKHGYYMLLLELKAEGENIKRVRDATKLWVRKDKRGKIIETDTHIRKAGEWHNPHIERQHTRHEELKAAGYFATFAIGLEQAKLIVCRYMGVKYKPPVENGDLF